ncbi:MAG: nucleotidyltransferase domain-containing protein [Elusimicrobiota bacterium]|nr:nucleotidyltransferase domain-containing protein [Elusimicrobiota bacterium]
MERNIAQFIQEFVNQVVMKYSDIVIKMILFGSVAKGISGPDSDCDILIVMEERKHSIL